MRASLRAVGLAALTTACIGLMSDISWAQRGGGPGGGMRMGGAMRGPGGMAGAVGAGAGGCQMPATGTTTTNVPVATPTTTGTMNPYAYWPYPSVPQTASSSSTNSTSETASSLSTARSKRGATLRQSVLAEFDKDGNGKLEGEELTAARLAAAKRREQASRN